MKLYEYSTMTLWFILIMVCVNFIIPNMIRDQTETIVAQNQLLLEQMAYIGTDTLRWNSETGKIETFNGEIWKTWDVWELSINDYKYIDKMYEKDVKGE